MLPIPRVNRPDRSQLVPSTTTYDDLVPADHPVRAFWEFTGELDLAQLYAEIKSVEGGPGRAATDPRLLTALWMYATFEGIATARSLDDRCRRDDVFKWLCAGVGMNYHTLSDFRVGHQDWLQDQCVDQLVIMFLEGHVDLEQVGQDGMKVRAWAGKGSFRKIATLEEARDEAQRVWEEMQEQFDEERMRTAREAAQQRAARERAERTAQACEELPKVAEAKEKRKKGDGEKARASTTEPTARTMKMGDGGFRPAYNVQFATTLGNLILIGWSVTQAGNDSGQIELMLRRLLQIFGELPDEYFADGGFASRQDVIAAAERALTYYCPIPREKQKLEKGEDPYAPMPGDTPALAAWRARMGEEASKEKYKNRCKCEWTNAMCRQRGMQQFVVRGLEKVETVTLWYVLVHNFTRREALRSAASDPV